MDKRDRAESDSEVSEFEIPNWSRRHGFKEVSKSFINDGETLASISSLAPVRPKEESKGERKFSVLLKETVKPVKKQTMKTLKCKKRVRILEDYFYHKEESVNEVTIKPLIIHELKEILPNKDNQWYLKT